MGYKFNTNIEIERPFFLEMVWKLNGEKSRSLLGDKEKYQVLCPHCHKKKAVMGHIQSKNSFVFLCPVDVCDLKGLVLHELIKRYGGVEMFNRWRRARWHTTYSEKWFPIKTNRQK